MTTPWPDEAGLPPARPVETVHVPEETEMDDRPTVGDRYRRRTDLTPVRVAHVDGDDIQLRHEGTGRVWWTTLAALRGRYRATAESPATPPEIPAAALTPPGGGTTLDEATRAAERASWPGLPPGISAEEAHRRTVAGTRAAWEVFTARRAAELAAQRERIARAIEVAAGERCPECGGSPASLKWKHGSYVRLGRCGAGHTWEHKSGDYRNPADVARGDTEVPGGFAPLAEAQAYIEALKGERDEWKRAAEAASQRRDPTVLAALVEQANRAEAELTAAEQRGRERAARDIKATRAAFLAGEVERPKVGPATFLNDAEWAEQVARGATPTPAGGEAQPSEDQLAELATAIRRAARIEGVGWIGELGMAGVGELARALYGMWPRVTAPAAPAGGEPESRRPSLKQSTYYSDLRKTNPQEFTRIFGDFPPPAPAPPAEEPAPAEGGAE